MATRAFLGLDLDDRFTDASARLGRSLATHRVLTKARWVARDLTHLTLRFFASLEAPVAAAIAGVVPSFEGRALGAVDAAALLAFPEPRRARVLALDLTAPAVVDLARDVDRALAEIGIAADPRPFHAHVTIARLREPADLSAVLADPIAPISGRAPSLTFYESVLGPSGPTYTVLARATLA